MDGVLFASIRGWWGVHSRLLHGTRIPNQLFPAEKERLFTQLSAHALLPCVSAHLCPELSGGHVHNVGSKICCEPTHRARLPLFFVSKQTCTARHSCLLLGALTLAKRRWYGRRIDPTSTVVAPACCEGCGRADLGEQPRETNPTRFFAVSFSLPGDTKGLCDAF